MKKSKLTVCLLAGVLLLAVSAGAAFGSVNGYAAYKNGVKTLMLECNNVSLAGSMSVSVDGKEVYKTGGEAKTDGANSASHTWEGTNDVVSFESYSVTVDGLNISYNSNMEEHTYRSYQSDRQTMNNLVGYDQDDEMERRMVNFMELAADTVVGDLKNNFVSLGKEGDVNRYQVNISKNQVPALINAGLSLIAYSEANSSYNRSRVVYEDYDQSFRVYYKEVTGNDISQELNDNYWQGWDEDWVDANQQLVDDFSEIQSQYSDRNYDVLEKKDGGVAYVNKDNSVDYYANQLAFLEVHPEEYENNMEALVGEDLSLENVECTFGVDGQGRLVENTITAAFATTDMNGKAHSFSFTFSMSAKDYGTTVVELPDLTGWKDISREDATVETVDADAEEAPAAEVDAEEAAVDETDAAEEAADEAAADEADEKEAPVDEDAAE